MRLTQIRWFMLAWVICFMQARHARIMYVLGMHESGWLDGERGAWRDYPVGDIGYAAFLGEDLTVGREDLKDHVVDDTLWCGMIRIEASDCRT